MEIWRYMEKRKLQRTGGMSHTVTLPKQWLSRHQLDTGDSIIVSERESGALTLRPADRGGSNSGMLSADGLPSEHLVREIIAHYLSGTDTVRIQARRLSPMTRKVIRDLTRSLVGLQIVDESENEIVLRNVFDSSKLSIQETIANMFRLASSMVVDALTAVAKSDRALARDCIDRDVEVDKLKLAITRQRHLLLLDKVSEEDMGLGSADLNYAQHLSAQLERVADHAVKIAHVAVAGGGATNDAAKLAAGPLSKRIVTLLSNAGTMVRTLEKSLAHSILDTHLEMEKSAFLAKKTLENQSPLAIIVRDSLDRIRGYVMNMAELTLDQAVMKENRSKNIPTKSPDLR